MYPFIGSPLNFGAMRFGSPGMNVQGMNNPYTAAQLLGVQGFGNQSLPIQPRQYAQAPQVPQMAPQQPVQQPQMMQRPMGLLSRDFGGRGNGGQGPGRGGGFGGGQGPQHGPGSGGSRSGKF